MVHLIKGKGFGNLITVNSFQTQMGKGNNDMELSQVKMLRNAGENKWIVQRGETHLQRDTTHFTIKLKYFLNQNSAKELVFTMFKVFKKYHIPLHHTEGYSLKENGYGRFEKCYYRCHDPFRT